MQTYLDIIFVYAYDSLPAFIVAASIAAFLLIMWRYIAYKLYELRAIHYAGLTPNYVESRRRHGYNVNKVLLHALTSKKPIEFGDRLLRAAGLMETDTAFHPPFDQLFKSIAVFNEFTNALSEGDGKRIRAARKDTRTLINLAYTFAEEQRRTGGPAGKVLEHWSTSVDEWARCAEYLIPRLKKKIDHEKSGDEET